MRAQVVRLLVCPICGTDLRPRDADDTDATPTEMTTGTLTCMEGHGFPVVDGVPRLLVTSRLESGDARSIKESFSRQWEHFDYEAEDRTWGQTVDARVRDFLRMVDQRPDELEGKLVLDAGCGNGVLSEAITQFRCDVLAADISTSIAVAHRKFRENPQVNFVQADLMAPPFRPAAFDIVFCAGVLIVTPDSRTTFRQVARAVSPGGRLFVWVYWKESKPLYEDSPSPSSCSYATSRQADRRIRVCATSTRSAMVEKPKGSRERSPGTQLARAPSRPARLLHASLSMGAHA